jgi:alcohol dehydrogenase
MTQIVSHADARATGLSALALAGVPDDHAATQIDLLLEAELCERPSHGLLRLPRVIERIRNGVADPVTEGVATWRSDAFLQVDGRRGLGPVVAGAAIAAITARARQTGIAVAAIANNNHLGMLGWYVERIAAGGQTAIAMTTSEALVHPWGGRQAMLGTNPIAIGVPATPFPLVLDMATSLVAMGRIHDHALRGEPLPAGWALDAAGEPTTDAEAAKHGAIAPFGGPKGYGLGLALEVLVAALTGAALGTDVVGTLDSDRVCNKGDVFIVVDPVAGGVAENISAYLDAIRACPPSRPGEPVLVPGDGSRRRRAERLAAGIPVAEHVWAEICALAQAHRRAAPGAPDASAAIQHPKRARPMIDFTVMRAPRAVLFGKGQRFALGRVVRPLGTRALICTDTRFAATAEMAELRATLDQEGIALQVFDGTEAELPLTGILACLESARPVAPEVVIGVGGGSCLDLGKVVSLMLTHDGPADSFYGENKVPGPVLPVVALPTTSGTGSEVSPVAVLGDSSRALKVGISSPFLIPHTAICDPELTLTCPPGLTALSGADAMTHAIESFTAVSRAAEPGLALDRVFVGKNRLSDDHALAAIRALSTYLPRAVANGADLEARAEVMYAAMLAGLAFGSAGTAAAHAIQYPVGALTHTAHGLGVAALMPYVMAFNRPACTATYAEIARTMGIDGGGDEELADAAVVAVASLFDGIRIPRTLAELGLEAGQRGWVAEQSLAAARLVTNNPRALDLAGAASIVDAAFAGERPWARLSAAK